MPNDLDYSIGRSRPYGKIAKEKFDEILQEYIVNPLVSEGYENLGPGIGAGASAVADFLIPEGETDLGGGGALKGMAKWRPSKVDKFKGGGKKYTGGPISTPGKATKKTDDIYQEAEEWLESTVNRAANEADPAKRESILRNATKNQQIERDKIDALVNDRIRANARAREHQQQMTDRMTKQNAAREMAKDPDDIDYLFDQLTGKQDTTLPAWYPPNLPKPKIDAAPVPHSLQDEINFKNEINNEWGKKGNSRELVEKIKARYNVDHDWAWEILNKIIGND